VLTHRVDGFLAGRKISDFIFCYVDGFVICGSRNLSSDLQFLSDLILLDLWDCCVIRHMDFALCFSQMDKLLSF
jgi:hypothetical protein